MNKKIETTVALALLAAGLIAAVASIQTQQVKADVNCRSTGDTTSCSGGSGGNSGGGSEGGHGSHFTCDSSTDSCTISGGGSENTPFTKGGGGFHGTCDSTGACDLVGGSGVHGVH